MPADSTIIVTAVIAMFTLFSVALAYVQVQTHGLLAPGSRPLD